MFKFFAGFLIVLAATCDAPAVTLLGVEWDSSDSKVYHIDSNTGEVNYVGNSGFPALNSLTKVGSKYFSLSQPRTLGAPVTLIEIDSKTGVGSSLGVVSGINRSVPALAWSESTGLLARSGTTTYYRIDIGQAGEMPTASYLGSSFGTWRSVQAMDFDSVGELYLGLVSGGFAGDVNSLAIGTMDPESLAISNHSTELAVGPQALEFLPSGRLLAWGNTFNNGSTHNLYSVDLNSGAFTPIGDPNSADIRGLAIVPEPKTFVLILLTNFLLAKRIRLNSRPNPAGNYDGDVNCDGP